MKLVNPVRSVINVPLQIFIGFIQYFINGSKIIILQEGIAGPDKSAVSVLPEHFYISNLKKSFGPGIILIDHYFSDVNLVGFQQSSYDFLFIVCFFDFSRFNANVIFLPFSLRDEHEQKFRPFITSIILFNKEYF